MTADRAAGHAAAQSLYEDIRADRDLPLWADLRLRTRDMLAGFLRAVGKDIRKPPGNRAQVAQDSVSAPTPTHSVQAAPAAQNRGAAGEQTWGRVGDRYVPCPPIPALQDRPGSAGRYAAGQQPDPGAVLLAEANFAPG